MSRQPPSDIVICAQNCQKKYGLWASLSLAQWALESAWGSRTTGKYNYFGIKAKTGSLIWTHEYVNGKSIAIQQTFADYDSPQDAFNAHAELLTSPSGHYAKALPAIGNLEAYVKAIGPIYATDPNYAESILNLIHSNQLTQYDINENVLL
jgi:flagellum-specific peptidoglycan hydrolase FlgJ